MSKNVQMITLRFRDAGLAATVAELTERRCKQQVLAGRQVFGWPLTPPPACRDIRCGATLIVSATAMGYSGELAASAHFKTSQCPPFVGPAWRRTPPDFSLFR